MAPRDRNPLDPDRIDISLDLMGEGSLRAIEALTTQLSTVSAHLNSLGSQIPELQAQGARTVVGAFNQGLGVHEGPSPYRSQTQASPVQDAAGQGGSYAGELHELSNMSFRQRLSHYRQQGGTGGAAGLIDREIDVYGAREREQATRRAGMSLRTDFSEPSTTHAGTQYDRDMIVTPGGAPSGAPSNQQGAPSEGASLPRPAWMQALQANPAQWERAQEGFVLPQFGELTIQDKLRMGSDFFTRSATRAYERSYAANQRVNQPYNAALAEATSLGFSQEEFDQHIAPGEGLEYTPFTGGAGVNRGRAANLLRMGADQAAQVVTIARDARRLMAYGGGINQQGVAAGFERGGTINIPGTDFGILNPLDMLQSNSAFREAINQRVNVQRLRMRGGINGEQAQEIIGSLASLGWTGEEGQNLAFDTVSPLVQQGQNPGIVSGLLDQSIRNGNTSLEDFRSTMDDLGPSARAARMSLDEYQESLGAFAEAAQEQGAFFGQGLRLGRNLSSGFGITPQQSTAVMQSPLTQGLAMMNYGVLPNELGALNQGAIGNATNQSVDMALRAAGAFNRDVVRDGKVVLRGRDRQSIQAAQFMGVSRETFERLRRGRDITPHIFEAQEALEAYGQGSSAIRKDHGAVKITTGDIKPGDWVPVRRGSGSNVHDFGNGIFGAKATVAGHGEKINVSADAAGAAGEVNQQWDTVEKQLRAMAPKGAGRKGYLKDVDALDDLDPAERAKKARKMLNEEARKIVDPEENKQTISVRFTGSAAKYFEQVERDNGKPKKDSNAGGKPVRETASGHNTETDYIELLRAQGGVG
jgi:hypothetical protein